MSPIPPLPHRPCSFVVVALALTGAVLVGGAAGGCASNASYAREEGRYREQGYDGDESMGAPMADASRTEATSASAPSPMSSIGDGLSNFFGGADKSAAPAAQSAALSAPSGGAPSGSGSSTTPPNGAPPQDDPTRESGNDKPMEAAKRLVIYTGSMALMVPTVDTVLANFVEQVTAMGGYLQARSQSTVTVRVPASQFFVVVDSLRKVGTVTDEQINATDVTKRVFDIELRLQTAEESRKRLVDILKSATKIEDILRIEIEIRRLTDEIEGMKGELRNLGDQVAFSTLTVSFFANAPSPRPYPDRTRSRFEWINEIGVEQVLYGF